MTGLPATRFGDNHACPATWPAKEGESAAPHLGGVFVGPCAQKVFIEGARAVRLADYAFCIGTGVLDMVAEGASTVLIEQLPAARVTDRCLHGGSITEGANKVRIGGPTFRVPSNVTIVGTPNYQNRVVRDLFCMSTTPKGRAWLRRLEATGQPVLIVSSDGTGMNRTVDHAGGASTIQYDSTSTQTYEERPEVHIPAEPQSALAHEVVHAAQMGEGRFESAQPTERPLHDDYLARGEDGVPLPGVQQAVEAENGIRKEWGLPPRFEHKQRYTGPWTGPPSPLQRPGRY